MTGPDGDAPGISVVICTRNRAERLGRAIDLVRASMDEAKSAGLACELVVVDNGSTDSTADSVLGVISVDQRVQYVREDRPSIGFARLKGINSARGEVIVFTDDDVEVPPNWIARLTAAIREGRADAVVGGITIAEDLCRPWLTPSLAGTYFVHQPIPPVDSPGLIGANMSFRRDVGLRFGFDPALGVPRYPTGEDNLFYAQVKEAGLRIRGVPDAQVVHHFDPARLSLDQMERKAEGCGRSDAYFAYHWLHVSYRWEFLRFLWHRVLLSIFGVRLRGNRFDERLLQLRREVAFHREMVSLRNVPHRYAYRGGLLDVPQD